MPALILNDTRFLSIFLMVKEAIVFQCSKQAIKRRIDGNSFLTFRKRFNYRKFAIFINIKSNSGRFLPCRTNGLPISTCPAGG